MCETSNCGDLALFGHSSCFTRLVSISRDIIRNWRLGLQSDLGQKTLFFCLRPQRVAPTTSCLINRVSRRLDRCIFQSSNIANKLSAATALIFQPF
jgi:hypothetical protein